MASKLAVTLTEAELKQKTPAKLRHAYIDLADNYNRIIENEILLCPKCNEFKQRKNFYTDRSFNSGHFPVCKQCLQFMSEQRDDTRKPVNETKHSFQMVLRFMNKPYIDRLYESIHKRKVENLPNTDVGELSILPNYLTVINSFPQYKDKTWDNSEFGEVTSIDDVTETNYELYKDIIEAARNRFGDGYSDSDYVFLENEYQDWITRHECNTKSQEVVFESISIARLQKDRLIKKGAPIKDIKEIDRIIQDYMETGNLKPKQNSLDTLSDAQTFGTLIQKYETTRPLPEMDEDFKDVDKIGLYDEVFFRGHMAKALGLKNRFTHIYENFIRQFSATRLEAEDEEDSEVLFDQIFGKEE